MNNRRSFITGIKSTVLSVKEKNFIQLYKPWGVILFSRNIKTIKQAKKILLEVNKIDDLINTKKEVLRGQFIIKNFNS